MKFPVLLDNIDDFEDTCVCVVLVTAQSWDTKLRSTLTCIGVTGDEGTEEAVGLPSMPAPATTVGVQRSSGWPRLPARNEAGENDAADKGSAPAPLTPCPAIVAVSDDPRDESSGPVCRGRVGEVRWTL